MKECKKNEYFYDQIWGKWGKQRRERVLRVLSSTKNETMDAFTVLPVWKMQGYNS